jgi:hypothetical protein
VGLGAGLAVFVGDAVEVGVLVGVAVAVAVAVGVTVGDRVGAGRISNWYWKLNERGGLSRLLALIRVSADPEGGSGGAADPSRSTRKPRTSKLPPALHGDSPASSHGLRMRALRGEETPFTSTPTDRGSIPVTASATVNEMRTGDTAEEPAGGWRVPSMRKGRAKASMIPASVNVSGAIVTGSESLSKVAVVTRAGWHG